MRGQAVYSYLPSSSLVWGRRAVQTVNKTSPVWNSPLSGFTYVLGEEVGEMKSSQRPR